MAAITLDPITIYSNGEDITETVLNRPINELTNNQSTLSAWLNDVFDLDGLDLNTVRHIRLPDNRQVSLGNSNDFAIYHTGSFNQIDIGSASLRVYDVANSNEVLRAIPGQGIDLYFNGSKKVEVNTAGARINDILSTGGINLLGGSGQITGITTVTNPGDAVSKAYADGVNSLGTTGYQILPSGLIMQWGTVGLVDNDWTVINFPVTYPTAVFGVWNNANEDGPANPHPASDLQSLTTSSFELRNDENAGGQTSTVYWFSLGY